MISNLEDAEKEFFDIQCFICDIHEVIHNLIYFKKEVFFTEEEYERLMDLKKKLSETSEIVESIYSLVEWDFGRPAPPDY